MSLLKWGKCLSLPSQPQSGAAEMVAFYKHDIPAWRGGTATLSDRAYRVYHVIVEQIMLHEGPVALHERSLAGLANRSIRDFRAALAELIAAGKVRIDEEKIHNVRAESELVQIEANRQNAAKGGRAARQKPAKIPLEVGEKSVKHPREVRETLTNTPREARDATNNSNENNAESEASLNKLWSLKEKTREEVEERKKDAAPNGAHRGEDLGQQERDFFRRGREVLGQNSGGLIAKLLKAKGGDPRLARAAVEQASTKDRPREWIGRILNPEFSETDVEREAYSGLL